MESARMSYMVSGMHWALYVLKRTQMKWHKVNASACYAKRADEKKSLKVNGLSRVLMKTQNDINSAKNAQSWQIQCALPVAQWDPSLFNTRLHSFLSPTRFVIYRSFRKVTKRDKNTSLLTYLARVISSTLMRGHQNTREWATATAPMYAIRFYTIEQLNCFHYSTAQNTCTEMR